MASKRLLVAWFGFGIGGSIGRFINVAKVLHHLGHEVGFVSLNGWTKTDWADFPAPIMTLEEAFKKKWDAVMIPGAGRGNLSDETLMQLEVLKDDRFGVRVQHILNDTSIYRSFEFVNKVFQPHVVIINNNQWSSKDFRTLDADAFYILPGAVDTNLFYPLPLSDPLDSSPKWKIGGFAAKNLDPLLAAINLLPENYILHLYGAIPDSLQDRISELSKRGKIITYGPLFGKDLACFYRGLDLLVTTETRAGWCNTAAEAFACGLPCIVTEHGTVDFAKHLENSIILEKLGGETIAQSILHLTEDRKLMTRLGENAAATMLSFSWYSYCEKLLSMVERPKFKSYYRVPELGLFGKWEPSIRLLGLKSIFAQCKDKTVLDLGCAEGIVGYNLSREGAKLIHGFESDENRINFVKKIFAEATANGFECLRADLSDWSFFYKQYKDILLDRYDIVLFLGLYHHLPSETRKHTLSEALKLCGNWFVIRTPEKFMKEEDISSFINAHGFKLTEQNDHSQNENLGEIRIYKRVSQT